MFLGNVLIAEKFKRDVAYENEIKDLSSFLLLPCTFSDHDPPGLSSAKPATQTHSRAFAWKY